MSAQYFCVIENYVVNIYLEKRIKFICIVDEYLLSGMSHTHGINKFAINVT